MDSGGSVARLLLLYPELYKVRALTRDSTSHAAQDLAILGAEIVQANLTDPSSLPLAVEDCWGVFGVTNYYDAKAKDDPASEEQQGKNLVQAAKDASVQCFVWSTLPSSLQLSGGKTSSKIYEGKHHVDDFIREVGLPGVFVYTGNFYENMVLRKHVQYDSDRDVIEFNQAVIKPDSRLAMLWVERDLSAIVHGIFTQWDKVSQRLNHTYLLAVDRRMSPAELTRVIGKVSGKKAVYNVLPSTGWEERDKMFDIYNELGVMYPGREIPDPGVINAVEAGGLGVKLSGGAEEYVRERLLPSLGLSAS